MSNQSKNTVPFPPGPWEAVRYPKNNDVVAASDGKAMVKAQDPKNPEFKVGICTIGGWGTSDDQNRAIAHLISAAPEMLEALNAALEETCDRLDPSGPLPTLLRAAIAKAEGRN